MPFLARPSERSSGCQRPIVDAGSTPGVEVTHVRGEDSVKLPGWLFVDEACGRWAMPEQRRQQIELACSHRCRFVGLGVVVAKHVQNAMHHQQCQFVIERAGVRRCGCGGHGGTDHDVTEETWSDIGARMLRPGRIEREREHIGWSALTHVFLVERGDLGLFDEGERQLPRLALDRQRCERERNPTLQIDLDLMLLVGTDHGWFGHRRGHGLVVVLFELGPAGCDS